MNVAGIDLSSHAVDIVTVPLDEPGTPVWTRYELHGADAFDRARTVAQAMPGPWSVWWDDVLAVGIEHPAGHHGTGPLLRVQGAILACIPPRMLVHPLPPSKWRQLVGLKGNASKGSVASYSARLYLAGPPERTQVDSTDYPHWPQDAHDAHLIALATRSLIEQAEAA